MAHPIRPPAPRSPAQVILLFTALGLAWGALWLAAGFRIAFTLAGIAVASLALQAHFRRSAPSASPESERGPEAPAGRVEPDQELPRRVQELARAGESLKQELVRQNRREEFLQALARSLARPAADDSPLHATLERGLELLGAPIDRLLLLLPDGTTQLQLAAAGGEAGAHRLPSAWPAEGSVAGLSWREGRSVAIADLAHEPALAAPFAPEDGVRAILAAPVRLHGAMAGTVVACAPEIHPWCDEDLRGLEWIAIQTGLLLEGRRGRESLLERNRELEQAARARDEFLALLGPELRIPLNPSLAAASALAQDARLPADARMDALMIRRHLAAHVRLVDDLLDLTRLHRRQFNLAPKAVAVAPLIREAAGGVGGELEARDQRLLVREDLPEDACVFGDPFRLRQACLNLLRHALHGSSPGSRVQFGARVLPGASPRVAISAETDRPARPQPDGGLGLALARSLVELHGGRLVLEIPGSGRPARFGLELPLREAPAGSPMAVGAPASEPGPSLRILLVEDHVDTAQVICRLLQGAGHRVTLAHDAASALGRFSVGAFDLLISDLGLPDQTGLALMAKLRQLQPSLPGICMTGYGMESDLEACRTAGFSEHLAKPVEVQRLYATIARVSRPSVPAGRN